jgi:hypothetical protein
MILIENKKIHVQKGVQLNSSKNNAHNLNEILMEHLKTLKEYDEKSIKIDSKNYM